MPNPQRQQMQGPPPFIPIPKHNQELLEGSRSNFSLIFPRLMGWKIEGPELKKPNDAIEKLFTLAQGRIGSLKPELEKIHRRQESVLKCMKGSGYQPLTLYAKLLSPFISGLGSGHPNETGMILDRNTGCPFLPASSIKGVLRTAYALNLAETDPSKIENNEIPDCLLRKYFGDVDEKDYPIPRNDRTRGQIVFLDAYPISPPTLKLDIMNPHYAGYYEQKDSPQTFVGPVETESPVPIKFIALEKGSVFVFRCFFLPLASADKNDNVFSGKDPDVLRGMWATAFSRLGFGGKTAIGYGRFGEIAEDAAKNTAQKAAIEILLIELKPGEIHAAILKEIKKEKWRVTLQSSSEINGVILNSAEVPEDKEAGDLIQVKVKSKNSPGMYNFDYIPDI